MPITTSSTHVTSEQIGRVGAVVQMLTNLSHSKMRGLFDHGCVTVNGQSCGESGKQVRSGDRVEVRYDPRQGYPEKKKQWTDRTFQIVFEDEHLLVVNKSANVLTIATDHGERNTLENRITHYLKRTGHKRKAFVVHRLDRGVSGLLVFAKTPKFLAALQEQFKQRKPERVYVAIVAGVMKSPAGTFRSYLETGGNLDQFSTRESGQGELAITHYQVRQQLSNTTVVEVRLETGRRNQIRVHFADHGHPVLGDPRYNRKLARHERWPKSRLALHATLLGFTHPATGLPMQFHAELPNLMKRFIGK